MSLPEKKGILFVLSGPSGVGKGTVCAALRPTMPNLVYSVSATTRPPRAGEREGVNYFFKTEQEFEQMIASDAFLEWAEYVGNKYGTPRAFVEENLRQGKDVILEIEVKGARQVKERFPEGIFLFLLPPTLRDLRQRIETRGTESEESILRRLGVAKEELSTLSDYDYAIVNDQVERACERIRAIITAEHHRTSRLLKRYRSLIFGGVGYDDDLS